MFWSKKNKKKVKKAAEKKKPSSAEIRAEAMANMRKARENIGEKTLDKIAAAMTKKQQSQVEHARKKIQDADAEQVAAEILDMMNKKD